LLLAGERDASAKTVSFRYRSGEQVNDVGLEEAKKTILDAISERRQV
jgi:threonyl-tRNA synthetase